MMRKFLSTLLFLLCGGVYAQDIAIIGAKVYPSPDATPISNATILIRAGKIVAVGTGVPVPQGLTTLPCAKCVVLAGFWNSHVHFTESKWADAAHQPAEQLTRQLQQMLTLSGFTTVVDTASDPENTVALRRRIEAGEVSGPHIYTAGAGLYPPNAIPYYLKDLPLDLQASLPKPNTPAEAEAAVQRNVAAHTDIVKLFTATYVARGHVVAMPLPIARAAVEAGHQHGQLVFAHPSTLEGARVAMEAGVDVLAHAPDTIEGVDHAFLLQVVAHHIAMIPTLKLFSDESAIAQIRSIVADFHRLGGQLIFGTDTGFLTDYDLTEEYRQLGLAGLNYRDILAMLTTNPAQKFHVADRQGRIAVGMKGDLTVLSVDPASGDPLAFTHVRYTIRGGRIIAGAQ